MNGVKHGKGCINFYSGDIYRGDFKENEFDGEGTYTFQNGDLYSG